MGEESNILENIHKGIEESIPRIAATIMTSIEDRLAPILGKIDVFEKRLFSMRDDVHHVLEGLEIRKNKERYSAVIVHGIKEAGGGKWDMKMAEELVMGFGNGEDMSEELNRIHGGPVLAARRLHMDPKPNEARPLVVTLATDTLREIVIRKGNKMMKEKGTKIKFKDNVCRETRLKRRVLGLTAGAIRENGSKLAIVPYDVRAKLLVETASNKGPKKFKKYTYIQAVHEFGELASKETMAQIHTNERALNIEQILLL